MNAVARAAWIVLVLTAAGVAGLLLHASAAWAQADPLPPEFAFESLPTDVRPVVPGADQTETAAPAPTAASTESAFLIAQVQSQRDMMIGICAFAVVTLVISLTFLRDRGSAGDIVTVSALNFLIFGTILLAVVSQDVRQLTAAIGVIGAIAGYLFRSMGEVGRLRSLDGPTDQQRGE